MHVIFSPQFINNSNNNKKITFKNQKPPKMFNFYPNNKIAKKKILKTTANDNHQVNSCIPAIINDIHSHTHLQISLSLLLLTHQQTCVQNAITT